MPSHASESVCYQVRLLEDTTTHVTVLQLGSIGIYTSSCDCGVERAAHRTNTLLVQSQKFNSCLSGRTIKWLFGWSIVSKVTGNSLQTFTRKEWETYQQLFDEAKHIDPRDDQ